LRVRRSTMEAGRRQRPRSRIAAERAKLLSVTFPSIAPVDETDWRRFKRRRAAIIVTKQKVAVLSSAHVIGALRSYGKYVCECSQRKSGETMSLCRMINGVAQL
jgi:hypothetical protein